MATPGKQPPWARYASLGFVLPSCLVTGYLLGLALDRLFHTSYLYLVFLLLGIAAGFVELIRLVRKNSE